MSGVHGGFSTGVDVIVDVCFERDRGTSSERRDGVLGQVERGEIEVQVPGLNVHLKTLERNLKRISAAIVFLAFFVGSIELILAGLNLPGYILLGISLIPLLVVIFR